MVRIEFSNEEIINLIQILEDYAFDCAVRGYVEWTTIAKNLQRKIEKADAQSRARRFILFRRQKVIELE